MEEIKISFVVVVLSLFIGSAAGVKKPYVVYLGGQHDENLESELVARSHHQLLGSVLASEEAAKDNIFYSYTRSMNGFAATLDEDQAVALSKLPQVVSVFPSKTIVLHTTRSIEFLGLQNDDDSVPSNSLWNSGSLGNDVIIGNLDSGVWPQSESFSDKDMGDIPSKWKGVCQNGAGFGPAQCNKKLIGARYFYKGFQNVHGRPADKYLSPYDQDGHGTHTLSTAGGKFVANASLYGRGEGVAKGAAPNARVAAYKVCWTAESESLSCEETDILAAFDAGISDGVDVFSVSIGGAEGYIPDGYSRDAISIGSFHAVQSGRVVVCSAGNSGPDKGSVQNIAPWIITVAASTIDRDFPSLVSLGDGRTYVGQSLDQSISPPGQHYPLVSSVNVTYPNASDYSGQHCLPGSLDPSKVKGNIVACLRGGNPLVEKGKEVFSAGGVGIILCNDFEGDQTVVATIFTLPSAHLSAFNGSEVLDYIAHGDSPSASIDQQPTDIHVVPAPVMASFSSQGPNPETPDILKPDIAAPGVNILAANIPVTPAAPFIIRSGTSMACPHVAGIAALLRNAHPDWSPAAIRSAIMTTASTLDNTIVPIKDAIGQTAGPFNYGAGQVNPTDAADPGLVYDISIEDYYSFLCSSNYSSEQIKVITGLTDFSCPALTPPIYDLNYPSITVSQLNGTVIVRRNLTNVADGPGTYNATVVVPTGVSVSVDPNTLQFSKTWDTQSFNVTLTPTAGTGGGYAFGSLAWQSPKYLVISPIVVKS